MQNEAKWLSGAFLATTAALALMACPALAQRGSMAPARSMAAVNPAGAGMQFMGRGNFQAPSLGTFNPGFGALNLSTGGNLAALNSSGLANMTSLNPYTSGAGLYGSSAYGAGSAYGGYPYAYSYPDPYGGGLRGAAEAINAAGQFEVQWQQARQLAQQVEQSKLETRRKVYDEWLYEQATQPTVEDLRERTQATELRRVLHDAPLVDIASGYALNTLLDDLAAKPNYAGGPNIALDPTLLEQVNVTSRENRGNIGVLKSIKEGAPLPWPLPLQGAAYREQTRRLNKLAADAVNMARNGGPVAAGTLADMREAVGALRGMVSANVNELTPSQVVQAKRFLSQLDDATLALKQPNVANYFTDKWVAKGKTAGDLVSSMLASGLRFAPAADGDEAAYTAAYEALLAYRNGLEPEVARGGGK
jgi:hypothetical protein